MVSPAIFVIHGFGLCLFAAAVGDAAEIQSLEGVKNAQMFDVLDADPSISAELFFPWNYRGVVDSGIWWFIPA